MSFLFEWKNSKNPKTVTLPNGSIEEVSYMRDGICLFKSGRSATYKRIGDYGAEFTLIQSPGEMNDAILNYRGAQEVGL